MQLNNELGDMPIKDVLKEHPQIGEILDKHAIGCIKCSVGTCLLKDVVAIHFLGDATEQQIEIEINAYLETSAGSQAPANPAKVPGA
jgi:hypothetical protein